MPESKSKYVQRAFFDGSFNLPPGVMLLGSLKNHGGRIRCLAWSPDGRMIAVASETWIIELLDAATGELIRVLERPESSVNYLAFSPIGGMLASCGDGVISMWDTFTGNLIYSLDLGYFYFCLAFDPAGKILASGSRNSIDFW